MNSGISFTPSRTIGATALPPCRIRKNRGKSVRYYQHNAINRALEAIADGKDRILLTLATGTGKTTIAFQLAWKLFESRWNLGREPTRRPRILFLADRNILADQAYNEFSDFPEDALARIKPSEIAQEGPRAEEREHLFHDLPNLHERH